MWRLLWSAAHSAFGEVLETWHPPGLTQQNPLESPFRLKGQYYDAETELCSTRHRYFDAGCGHWLSADPIGTAGGYALYDFNGAPTVVSDPLGLSPAGKNTASDTPSVDSGSPTTKARKDFPDIHPKKKKDASAPETGTNKLNSDHLTAEQKKHFEARKDEAKKKLGAAETEEQRRQAYEELLQARYEQNVTSRENRKDGGLPPEDPAAWRKKHDQMEENGERGRELENTVLKELGLENNNHRNPPTEYPTETPGKNTRPDATSNRPTSANDGRENGAVVDVKSLSNEPPPGGGKRTQDNREQLRGQQKGAENDDKTPVVVMASDDPNKCRPSKPLADASQVMHRDKDGNYRVWEQDPDNPSGPGKWSEPKSRAEAIDLVGGDPAKAA